MALSGNKIPLHAKGKALKVEVDFWMPVPECRKKTGEVYHCVKPDLDNLERLVLNAMTGLVYKDDCQVVWLSSIKRYARNCEPRTEVTIRGLEFVTGTNTGTGNVSHRLEG